VAKAKSQAERFLHLYERGYSAAEVAAMYQVRFQVVRDALDELGVDYPPGPKPKPVSAPVLRSVPVSRPVAVAAPRSTERVWCAQCDRLVYAGEVSACQSRFCKAKLEAA